MPEVGLRLPLNTHFTVHFFNAHWKVDQLPLPQCNYELPCASSVERSVREGLVQAVRVQVSPFKEDVVRSAARSAQLSSRGIHKVRFVKQRSSLRHGLLRAWRSPARSTVDTPWSVARTKVDSQTCIVRAVPSSLPVPNVCYQTLTALTR